MHITKGRGPCKLGISTFKKGDNKSQMYQKYKINKKIKNQKHFPFDRKRLTMLEHYHEDAGTDAYPRNHGMEA